MKQFHLLLALHGMVCNQCRHYEAHTYQYTTLRWRSAVTSVAPPKAGTARGSDPDVPPPTRTKYDHQKKYV